MNTAIAIGIAIDLTTQLLKLQQALSSAASEDRDITPDELKAVSESAQSAIDRLNATIASLR